MPLYISISKYDLTVSYYVIKLCQSREKNAKATSVLNSPVLKVAVSILYKIEMILRKLHKPLNKIKGFI